MSSTAGTPAEAAADAYNNDSQRSVVEPRDNITVIATDSNSWLGRESDNPRSKAELVAFNPNGSVRYYNDSHTRYWDVDPVPGTETTVEYMFSDHLNGSNCPTPGDYMRQGVNRSRWSSYAKPRTKENACTINGIERVNLTTGETELRYSAVTPGKHSSRWHDADRINSTHKVVADIYLDRVFIINTKTDRITWQWNATTDYSRSSGGPYPTDWTHVNDVEYLDDGRIMASLRNQDRVIFLDPSRPPEQTLLSNWTLGSEDNYSVLYEQHNPDYIPRERGGPAVIVADSENNRIVEYQRDAGEWKQSWNWKDGRMQWARDADRLPNDHTLITDSNGDRVFEVDQQGNIVWSMDIAFPYEAERLNTGDESTGGKSTTSINSATSQEYGPIEGGWLQVKAALAGPMLSATQYILPTWIGFWEFGLLLLTASTLLVWTCSEMWWRTTALRGRIQSRLWK